MNYKITTLAENSVYGKGLQGEHGLSLLVEAGEHKVLFDTGASDLFIRNARLMGVDLTDVEFVILSHGHRDHTGVSGRQGGGQERHSLRTLLYGDRRRDASRYF